MNVIRYTMFVKSAKLYKRVQLVSLSPTSAAQQHFRNIYYQIYTRLGN